MNHKALPSIMDIDESPDPELFEGVDTGLEFAGNPLCCENIMHWWCYYMFLPQIVLGSEIVLLTCSMFWGPRCPVTEPAIDDPRKEELLEVMPCNKNKLKWLPWWDHVDQVKSQKNWIEDAYVIRCCSIMSTAFSINILIYEDYSRYRSIWKWCIIHCLQKGNIKTIRRHCTDQMYLCGMTLSWSPAKLPGLMASPDSI